MYTSYIYRPVHIYIYIYIYICLYKNIYIEREREREREREGERNIIFFYIGGKLKSLYMHKSKEASGMRSKDAKLMTRYNKLANTWDHVHDLREGIRVRREESRWIRDGHGKKIKRPHPNQYRLQGMIRLSLRNIGKSSVRKTGIDGTSHQLAMLACTAGIADELMLRAISEEVKRWRKTMAIARHYDATPWHVMFGRLQGKMAPFARYLVKIGDEWKAVPLDEFQQHNKGKLQPKGGIMELFGQTARISSSTNEGRSIRDIVIAPRFLKNSTTASIHNAVEHALPMFSISMLKLLSKTLKYIIYHDVPDNISSNKRRQKYVSVELKDTKNILYFPAGCLAHLLGRVNTIMFDVDHTVGDIYAEHYVAQIPAHQNRLQKTLMAMLEEEFISLDPDGFPVQEANLKHTRRIIDRTLGRGMKFIRGRIEEDLSSLSNAKGASDRKQKDDNLIRMLNTDIRVPRVAHIEVGCCQGGIRKQLENTFAAIVESGILLGQPGALPSKIREGSMSAANSEQVAGDLIHNILPRCIMRAFRAWQDGDVPDADDEFRQFIQKKVWRTVHVQEIPVREKHVVMNWLSIPIDACWMQLEYMDGNDTLLKDIINERTNPLHLMIRRYTKMLCSKTDEGPLRDIFHHFQSAHTELGADMDDIVNEIRMQGASIVAQSTWRFIWELEDFPILWLRIVEPGATRDDRLKISRLAFEQWRCDVDE